MSPYSFNNNWNFVLFCMNRLNNTESAVFIIWMLHFQRTPFTYSLEITTSVVVPCGGSKSLPLNLFSVVIFTFADSLGLWDSQLSREQSSA